MDLGLKDKVVVITGANAGLGKGFIPAFLAEGCKVAACGRSEKANAALKAEFPEILVVKADVGKREDLERLAEEAAKTYGGIDIWINNAGHMAVSALIDMSEQDWQSQLNANLTSIFRAVQIAVPYMEKRGGGVIINASSFASLIPSAGTGAYAATKAAVTSLTRVYAAELAPKNIRVTAYIPGVFNTPMLAEGMAKNSEELLKPIAAHRFGQPEDIASAIVFLASDKASYITGTTLAVTGGKYCVQNAHTVWK